MPSPQAYIITFNVKPQKLDEFHQIMASVKVDLPKVAGCEGVNIFNRSDTQTEFILVENWRTQDLHEHHINNMIQAGEWAKLESLLAKPPTGHYVMELFAS